MKKSLSRKTLYSGVFILLLLASFVYGVFSVINQTMPFRIVWYLNVQKNKIFSESEAIKQGAWHIARNDLPNQGLTEAQKESLTLLSNTDESSLPTSGPFLAIEMSYPKREFDMLGFELHWLLSFFLLSLISGFAFKRFLRVEF